METKTLTEAAMLTLELGPAVAGGRCLARHEGKVLLVAGGLPGERVQARVTREAKSHAEADVVEVLDANPRRRTPPCPHALECGGCDFQHAERGLQLEMKRSIVLDSFRRIAHLDVTALLQGPAPELPEFGVRQRIRLSYDPAGRVGLLKRGTHDVVGIEDCLLMDSTFGKIVLPWLRLTPPWRRASVRIDSDANAVVLFETGDGVARSSRGPEALAQAAGREKDRRRFGRLTVAMERPPSIQGLLADRIPLAGKRELRFRVSGRELSADAASFFQGSASAAALLVRHVDELLGGERRGQLLDLYAGVGLLAVCLGEGFDRVLAVESDRGAARHLKRNLRRNGVRGEAWAESAETALRHLPSHEVETVIVDPPRVGLSKDVRRLLSERRPRRILSVSCDPATGARDAGELVRSGWKLARLAAVDLFPVTAQIETVALLERDGDS